MDSNKELNSQKRKQSNKNKYFKKRTKEPNVALKIFITCLKVIFFMIVIGGVVGIGAFVGIGKSYVDSAPELDLNKIKNQAHTSFIYDMNGKLVQELHGVENRVHADLSEMPEELQNAFIAIEDINFKKHHGISFRGIMRAALSNVISGDPTGQGASTITQQLIKNTILSQEQTYKRKIQEMYLAMQLEKKYSKDQILEAYLNTIYLGYNAYGVKTAAEMYFGKELDQLTLRESAMLAGINRNPYYYMPYPDEALQKDEDTEQSKEEQTYQPRDVAEKRTDLVLSKMYELGSISKDEYDEALSESIVLIKPKKREEQSSFIDYVYEELLDKLVKKYGWENEKDGKQKAENLINKGGLQIHTTLNPDIQKNTEQQIENFKGYPKATYKNYKDPKGFPDPQAAAVIIDYHTGEIRAMVGGRYGNNPKDARVMNRAVKTNRGVGSTIKPISVYGPLVDLKGSAGYVYENIPAKIPGWGGSKGFGANYDNKYTGLTTARQGIIQSINVVTERVLLESVGLQQSKEYLDKLGLNEEYGVIKNDSEQTGLSAAALSLGTDGASVLQMAAAYGTIGNKGIYIEPTTITKVVDRDGNIILDNKNPIRREVFKEETAWIMLDLMQDVINSGTGRRAQIPNMPTAGKTGTNTNKDVNNPNINRIKDVLFGGLTPYYSAFVWIGNDANSINIDGKPIDIHFPDGTYSSTTAGELWKNIMAPIHENLEYKEFFARPKGVVAAKICTCSGKIPTELCFKDPRHVVKTEYFIAGTVPNEKCNCHVEADICATSGKFATEFCPEAQVVNKVFVKRPADSPYFSLPDSVKAKILDTPYEMPNTENEDNYCKVHTSGWLDLRQNIEDLLQKAKDLLSSVEQKLNYYKSNYPEHVTSEQEKAIRDSSAQLEQAINNYDKQIQSAIDNMNKTIEYNQQNPKNQKPVNINIEQITKQAANEISSAYNHLKNVSDSVFKAIEQAINTGSSNNDNSNNNSNNNGNGNSSDSDSNNNNSDNDIDDD